MYTNIGGKIKILAKVTAWVGIIGSIITGLVMIFIGASSYGQGSLVGIGFIIMLAGSLSSCVSTWFVYGFGELIDNTSAIAANTSDHSASFSLKAQTQNEAKLKALDDWKSRGMITEEEYLFKRNVILGQSGKGDASGE
jgi:hypothetical protein